MTSPDVSAELVDARHAAATVPTIHWNGWNVSIPFDLEPAREVEMKSLAVERAGFVAANGRPYTPAK